MFLTITALTAAQEPTQKSEPIPPVVKPVTTQKVEKPVVVNDTVKPDTTAIEVPTDIVKPKSTLEFIIDMVAARRVLNRRDNTMTLYDNAVVTYGDTKIEAGKIIINNNTGNIQAYGVVEDSTGNYVQKPVFTQGANVVKPDSIIANKDSKKVLTYNSITSQGEFNIIAETTKKVNDSVFYMRNARFTTSANPEDPEYYFLARRIKFVPKKKIVTGLVNMVIADVPTPLGLPFAYFPMTTERRSGVIVPSFGNNNNQGYFLQNGGYYFAINDYVDLTVLGDYFTNGSWGGRLESNYVRRYGFSGSVRFLYENQIRSERGFSDFAQTTRYNINWQHAQDTKSSPDSRFAASVNLSSSSQFFRQSFNQVNQGATLVNDLSSSVSYSRTFQGEPQVNFTVAALHSQNANNELVRVTLPDLQASVSRVFPFAPKVGVKKGALHNINLQYNLRASNTIETNEDDFLTGDMFNNSRMGAIHSIPISTNFKVAKHFSVTAGGTYEENWVFETFDQTQVENDQGNVEVRRDTISGFDSYRTYNLNASVGTTVYGQWNNKNKDGKIQAIRHVIRPSVSYNINPSFDQYYDRLLDEQGLSLTDEERFFSRFEGTIPGAPGRVFSSNIGINVQNNIEAKVRDRDSTATELRKVSILKSLNLSTAYNVAGDSLNWNPLLVSGVVPITKSVDLNFDASFDPYSLDNNNQRINTFNINNNGSLFRLTRAGARMSFKLSDKDFTSDKDDDNEEFDRTENTNLRNGGREDDLFGQAVDYADGNYYEEEEETETNVDLDDSRYRFKIPWSLNVAYNVIYQNNVRQDMITQNSLQVSGDVELSPRWSVGGSTGYNFSGQGVTFSTLRFQRDLESWRMSFNWTPLGPNESWFFFIGIKSSALSDIKWDQRRQPDPQF